MRKLLTSLALLGLAASQPTQAHKEWVHQYMVQQAYLFLQNQIGQVPVLQQAAGLNYHGAGPTSVTGLDNQIAIGAWQEDVEDWVYGYNSSFADGATPSITHFWRADYGDEEQSVALPQLDANGNIYSRYYENAWQKARILLFCQNPTNGPRSITVPYTIGNSTSRYIISYTSLPELYKGNYWLDGTSGSTGYNYIDQHHTRITNNTSFGQPVALNILGRVAHLLGDMSVPAHAHAHLHPCPLGFPDYYENNMGGVWSDHNKTAECESDPGGRYPAQDWTAATAAAQGGFLSDIFCEPSQLAQMRYLFYSINQVTDFFPSGVNAQNEPNSPPTNRNGLVIGNANLPGGTTSYIQARYPALQGRFGLPPARIVQQDVGNEVFNGSIRAVATLFQWFAFESGMMPTLDNNSIVSTSGNYLLCPSANTLTFMLARGGSNVAWSVEPASMATGTLTAAGYVVTPTPNYTIGSATVKATFSTSYGPCRTYSATLAKALPVGPTALGMVTPDPAFVYEVEPAAFFELDAPNPNFPRANTTYTWSSDNGSSVQGFGSDGQAYVSAAYLYSTEFHVTVTATNACGSVTASRSFRTRDEHPPRCLTCDEQSYLTAGSNGGTGSAPPTSATPLASTAALASAAPPKNPSAGFAVSPNPNAGDFDVYYVSAKPAAPVLTDSRPTFTLLDVLGRTVAAGTLMAPTTHVVTSQLSTGIYLLKVVDHAQTHYKRIQVVH